MVNLISSLDDFKTAIGDSATGLVVIDFFASWCMPCKLIGPKYEKMAEKYPMVKFYKLDADNEATSSIVQACMIQGLPSFIFFKAGIYLNKMTGANEVNLEKLLLENLKTTVNKPTEQTISKQE